MLPQQAEAEALQQAFHPQAVSQEQQQHAGAGRAVHADHRALLRQETLGQSVAAGGHRRLGEGGRKRGDKVRGEVVRSCAPRMVVFPELGKS